MSVRAFKLSNSDDRGRLELSWRFLRASQRHLLNINATKILRIRFEDKYFYFWVIKYTCILLLKKVNTPWEKYLSWCQNNPWKMYFRGNTQKLSFSDVHKTYIFLERSIFQHVSSFEMNELRKKYCNFNIQFSRVHLNSWLIHQIKCIRRSSDMLLGKLQIHFWPF